MFIVNPDPYLLPTYRFSPFKTDYVGFNSSLPDSDFASSYLNEKFDGRNWQYTFNGREAIKLALESYNLSSNDLVTILTTSDNFYISSCVTKTIEGFCRWNREIVSETKIIFVNHEFGYPYPGMEKLVATGLPIIEDCCTTFFSQDGKGQIGNYGDFSVYSLPKFFPIQLGGLLVNNNKELQNQSSVLNDEQINYLKNSLSYQLEDVNSLLSQRTRNFEYASALFSKLDLTLRFDSQDTIVPYALVLKNNQTIKDLNALKVFLFNHGIQNSVFYGEDAFFIPIHQNLTYTDLDYFAYLISFFINQ